eukprot:1014304-Pelagomonas_calceolata.AAC.2
MGVNVDELEKSLFFTVLLSLLIQARWIALRTGQQTHWWATKRMLQAHIRVAQPAFACRSGVQCCWSNVALPCSHPHSPHWRSMCGGNAGWSARGLVAEHSGVMLSQVLLGAAQGVFKLPVQLVQSL